MLSNFKNMATKKFKTFCRIIDYIDSIDPELAELLRGTCADMSLGSLKGKPGITFLMPQNAAYRKKITDLAYSDNISDANKACDMLNALIIKDVLKTLNDWRNKRDDIPNSLLPSQHIEIDNITNKEIIFKSGAVAVLDEKFKDNSKKSQLAVWKLISGEIPVTMDKPSKFKYAKKKGGSKTGGYDVTPEFVNNIRFKIAIAIENAYITDRINNTMGSLTFGAGHEFEYKKEIKPAFSSRRRDIYLEFILSLVNFIMNSDEDLLYDKILPLISFQKIDFYNLLEPHTIKHDDSHYLIPTSLINAWWNNRSSFNIQSVIDQIGKKLSSPPAKFQQYKLYGDKKGVIQDTNNLRTQIMKSIESRPRDSPKEIIEVYKILDNDNKIGACQPVYPPGIAAYYKSEPSLKLAQDELRYLTYLQFESLERQPTFDRNKFETIINMIAEYANVLTSDERERTFKLNNMYTMKYLIQPTEKIQEIKIFLNSTHFLYVPLTPEEVYNYPLKNVIVRPDPDELHGIWNIDKSTISQHKRLAQSPEEQKSISEALNLLHTMNPSTMTPELKQSILDIYSKINKSQ